MDVPVQNSFFHAYSFKRVCFFILVLVITLIAALGAVALMVIFVLKPERPIFSVQTLNLDSYKLDVYSNSTLFISSVVSLRLNAQNPNKVGLRYSRSRLRILNQGLVIGLIRVPDFFQPPHSTNVSVSTRVLFQCVNVSQILSTHGIAKKMRISGDIKVYVRLFRIITLPKVKVALDLDIFHRHKERSCSMSFRSRARAKARPGQHLNNHSTVQYICLNLYYSAYGATTTTTTTMAAAKFELCALLALVVLCASLVLSSVPLLEICNTNKAALFIFGDSLYDPGNNNYINTTTEFQANFWPYGKSFFNAPTGRFSDGRLIPDFIAEYAKLPLIPPYLQPGNHQFLFGANFASGGAGALDQTYPGLVVNLRTQLSQFKNVAKQLTQQLGDIEAAELLSDSVYMISIGGNDYLSPARGDSKQSYTRQQFVDMVIGNFTTVIKEIYKKGGRKFSFLSLPPLGCWPSIKAQREGNTCDEDLAALVEQHMEAFSKNLNKLDKQLKGVEYSYFDLHTCFSDKMANPSKYGFKDGSSVCCGSGPYRGVYSCGGMRGEKEYELCENVSDYLFFDSYHPTQVAYQQLAKLMWEGGPIVTGPNNLKSLFVVSNKQGPKLV